jgi:hypothetical protein
LGGGIYSSLVLRVYWLLVVLVSRIKAQIKAVQFLCLQSIGLGLLLEGRCALTQLFQNLGDGVLDHSERKGFTPLRYLRKAHNFNVRPDAFGIDKIVTYGINED